MIASVSHGRQNEECSHRGSLVALCHSIEEDVQTVPTTPVGTYSNGLFTETDMEFRRNRSLVVQNGEIWVDGEKMVPTSEMDA